MAHRIFIAEDDKGSMALFKGVLNVLPEVKLITEKNGKSALRRIKKVRPDIIILDLQLPEVSGIEICKQLRKEEDFQETPIIAVTAITMSDNKETVLSAGFDKYITKPIRVKEFRKMISQYMHKR
jgi:two-component system cell cycle response regulator DivK